MHAITVLVIDSNHIFAHIAAQLLQETFPVLVADVWIAQGVPDALRHAREQRPQFILVDLMLVSDPSLALIAQLRALLPSVYVIAMSLFDTIYAQRAAFAAGADACIAKAALHTDFERAVYQSTPGKPS